MPSIFIIVLLSFIFISVSDASHHKKFPSAVVIGTVHCDTCFHQGFFKNSHAISGASVAIECKDGNSNPTFSKSVKTEENGEFQIHLPLSISKHINKIKKCAVKLISSNQPFCSIKSSAISSSIHLKGNCQGIHIFSAGFFTFKPLNQPIHCTQKPSQLLASKFMFFPVNNSGIPPPVTFPIMPQLPPLPQLPALPELPKLPPLPELPKLPPILGKNTILERKLTEPAETLSLPPNPFQPPSLFPPNPFQPILPPNPLQPPPTLFPPNPFQPPPSILPPNPLQPPPTPFIPFPTIPFFTPSPPPPAIPFLPPVTFPPVPRIPGVPPASSSVKTSP